MKTSPSSLRYTFGSELLFSLNKVVAVSALLSSLVILPAYADDLADVTKIARSGQFAEALSKADAFLAKHPHDPQMRFLKGVILTEQNKSAEAIGVFTKLTEDFPELPEPYNNLAVLFAASGQYDKARAALDNAIRTNPAYATAYENLGDVHAKLASQAYDKALQLDSGNATAKSKLTLLRTLANNNVSPAKAQAVSVSQPTPVTAPVTPQPQVSATSAASVKTVTPAPVVAKVEPKPEVKPEKTVSKPVVNNDDREEVLSVVHAWARAWSDQDVKAYLGYYGSEFEPPNGKSRHAWSEDRKERIEGKDRIEVKVESPQVTVNGNTATVKFRQIYSSDRLKADSRKILVLSKQGGQWQIKQERTGS